MDLSSLDNRESDSPAIPRGIRERASCEVMACGMTWAV